MSRPPGRLLFAILSICVFSCALSARGEDEYLKPSPYPISWEIDFTHSSPKRIVVDVAASAPQAYWYMTYHITNNTSKEQSFLPQFELMTENGNLSRSDQNVPQRVFDAIKEREHNKFLEPVTSITGQIRIGLAEARDGVAIWPEPTARLGHFSIFVAGLSGEAVTMKLVNGQYQKVTDPEELKDSKDLVILRKTLRLNFFIRGGGAYPNESEVVADGEQWIMR